MRYLLLIVGVFVLLFVPDYPVYAENNTTNVNWFAKDTARLESKYASREAKLREELMRKEQALKNRFASQEARLQQRLVAKEASLAAKLAQFKDRIKANRVSKVNDQIQQVNKVITDRMLKQLSQFEKMLVRLEENSDGSVEQLNAIELAQQSIDSTEALVMIQSQKSYQISISSEADVKDDAKAARDSLHNDLKALQEQMKLTKDAVQNAYQVVSGANQ